MTELSKDQKNIQWFLKYLRSDRNYSDDTVQAYQQAITEFCDFLDEVPTDKKELTKVDSFDVESFLTNLYEKQYARNSIAQKVSALKSLYAFLVKNEVIANNPFEYVHLKTNNRRLPRFLYQNEMRALFEGAKHNANPQLGLRNSAILEILYATGIRVSECAGIRLNDIDLDNRTILVTGKGNKQRYVPFGGYAQEAIESYLSGAREPIMKQYHQTHQFLFINHYGRRLSARGIEYIMDEIVKQSSLTTKIHPHMLRHTFATEMLNNGADMRSVQELLGHSSLSTTQIYTHVTKSHLMDDYKKYFPRNNDSLKSN
ncbi:tyrosine recombinase XerC [Lentilactobacillus kefiri]|uniref:Tyrosine recombinase XerC n=1 Tax=Lentilactobacillus kefiri TaxID=33962 RepID=A0A511DVV4_LENKE|nr:tyrosine recombinase XerC [Lentilactobacillus kefiri]KRL57583.1 Tyrosine recombinase xerC [Lentilactobacillus parakefiri DSM 10551]MCJ2162387.1 tyrosine recombinase XerC [Lentilactobacillus kefiri]MCP9369575.1 tyrosine recombinase XerC [Lentilactobacillus kefiri]MDH5107565.1 tyrosine recombinase XerC [Lentilactobacillus kefiri]MDM7493498.1 tyrosine recombinase XerC [Lentilactobacillus kefiri]